ncbi:papain-like cysteine protease family protein [Chryseobacterium herbae]|uniref:C39 family peptidase n=1 Tax=Chryseobacterium herbae TaxID=2976476 RepID=A0ABT2ITZ1_9FLAO|nr:papain-like cysteine protease family protein [Chryseobacterium sp. pc1-10]MCT2562296.1 C39 family peptidase [Chryseobacterium sp. pc1-10]
MKQIEKKQDRRKAEKMVLKPLPETDSNKLIIKTNEELSVTDSSSSPEQYLWNKSLPGCGNDVVSVLIGNGYIYAGSNGYVYQMDMNGNILNTNNLPGRGQGEIRMDITDNYLVVGTNGYVVLISLSDFANTSSNINVSLPGCGYNIVSVIVSGSYIFAGSNGYAYQLNTTGELLATNTLPGKGNNEVRLATTDTYLVAGINGYIVLVLITDFDNTDYNINISLTGSGYSKVSVLSDPNYIYAGSNGYVYQFNLSGNLIASNNLPGMGNNEIRLALNNTYLIAGTNGFVVLVTLNSFGNTAFNLNTSLPNCAFNIVSVQSEGDVIFAGSNGYAYQLSGNSGNIMIVYGLPGLGNHEVRIASNNYQLYLGTNGFLAATDQTVVLDVNIIGQQTNNWCWAASGQMVMEYLGSNISQCEQANYRFGLSNCCITPTPANCIQGGWPDFENWGFSSITTLWGDALYFDELQNQFDSNMPVAFSWGWTGGGGHMQVATGYSLLSEMVSINDPWPPNIGTFKWLSYNAYVQGSNYTHWRDYYNISKNTTVKSYKSMNDKNPNIKSHTFSSPIEAVNDGLNRFFHLVNDKNYRKMGLEKMASHSDAIQADSNYLKVYFIRHDSLLAFNKNDSPFSILIDLNERMYPVIHENEVVSAITIQQNKNEEWEVKSIGDSILIKEAVSLMKQSEDVNARFFIVTIPSLYHMFLGYLEHDNVLKLIEISAGDGDTSSLNNQQDASEILSAIREKAMNNPFPLTGEEEK